MIGGEGSGGWSRAEDKLFEDALVKFDDEEDPQRWQKIAGEVPGKLPEEIRVHFEKLVHDVMLIHSGRVALPGYPDDSWTQDSDSPRSGQISFGSGAGKAKRSDGERKKGTPWSEEEHKLFLIGLEKYGKGDWRSISRNVVVTRTPTQVASHAQKYYLRQNSGKKERKRTSIHDITTVGGAPMARPVGQSWVRTPAGNHQNQAPAMQPPEGFGLGHEGGSFGYQSYGFPM